MSTSRVNQGENKSKREPYIYIYSMPYKNAHTINHNVNIVF